MWGLGGGEGGVVLWESVCQYTRLIIPNGQKLIQLTGQIKIHRIWQESFMRYLGKDHSHKVSLEGWVGFVLFNDIWSQ